MRTLSYFAGVAIGIFGIVIFHPLLTLIGIGLTLLVHLPKEEKNARSL